MNIISIALLLLLSIQFTYELGELADRPSRLRRVTARLQAETDSVLNIRHTLLDLCVSSLRRGHANLLCIVPILTDDPRRESNA